MPWLLLPSIILRMPRSGSVSTITTSIGLAVARRIVHTSGTVLIALRTLTEKKRERVTWRSLLIVSSVPRQRRHDIGPLIKGDAKFVFTNVLHRSLVNITDGLDEVALTQYGIDAVAFVDINREES
jgi:hypothetical protein